MADAEIGRLSIRVMPDLKGFARELKNELKRIQSEYKLEIQVDPDMDGFAEKIKAEAARLSKSTKVKIAAIVDQKAFRNELDKDIAGTNAPTVNVPLRIDPKSVFNESRKIGARIGASIGSPTIKPKIDENSVWKESLAIGKRASKLLAQGFTIKPDFIKSNGSRGYGSLVKDGENAAKGIRGFFERTFRTLRKDAAEFGDGFGDSLQSSVGKVGQALSALGPYVQGVLYTTLAALLPAAIGGVTVALGGLETALLAIPSVVGAAGIAFGTLALAFSNLGNAWTAITTGNNVEAKLAELQPAAAKAMRGIRPLVQAFQGLKDVVQQNFFAPFADSVGRVANQWIPILQKGLTRTSKSLGNFASGFVDALGSPRVQKEMSKSFGLVAKFFDSLKPMLTPFIDSMTQLMSSGLEDFLVPLAGYISKAAKAFDSWVTSAKNSGELHDMFQNLLGLVKAIGKPLAQLASGIAKAFASKESAKSIQQLGDGLSELVKTILPYLPVFIEDFGKWAVAIGKFVHAFRWVFTAFDKLSSYLAWWYGTALPGISGFFGDTLPNAIKSVGKFFTNFGGWIGDAAKGVANFFTKTIPGFFTGVGKSIGKWASGLWSSISNALSPKNIPNPFSGMIDGIKKGFQDLGQWFNSNPLGRAISGLVNNLIGLGADIQRAINSVIKLGLSTILSTSNQVASQVGGFFSGIWSTISSGAKTAWTATVNYLYQLWNGIVSAAKTAWAPVANFFSGLWATISNGASKAWHSVSSFLSGVWRGISSTAKSVFGPLVSWIQGKWNTARSVTSAIWGKIRSFLSGAWKSIGTIVHNGTRGIINAINGVSVIVTKIRRFFNGLTKAASGGVGSLVSYVRGIPRKISNAVGNLSGILYNAGRSVINGLIRGIRSAIGSLSSVLGGITDMIPNWKGPAERDKNLLYDNGQLIMGGLIRGIEDTVPSLRSSLSSITGQIGGMALATDVHSELTGAYEQTITVPVYLDTTKVAEGVAKGNRKIARRG